MEWRRDKPGNLYWLAYWLTLSIGTLGSADSDPLSVELSVLQSLWHATELSLGDPVEENLKRLCEKTHTYSLEDWNDSDKRQELQIALHRLVFEVGELVEGDGYVTGPPPGWKSLLRYTTDHEL